MAPRPENARLHALATELAEEMLASPSLAATATVSPWDVDYVRGAIRRLVGPQGWELRSRYAGSARQREMFRRFNRAAPYRFHLIKKG